MGDKLLEFRSPRTSHVFVINPDDLDKALSTTWHGTDEDFVKMVRTVFGLTPDGPQPFWEFLEMMQVVMDDYRLAKVGRGR